MHTYNLLTEHADRSTIAPEGLVLLDAFLERQRVYQAELRAAIEADQTLAPCAKSDQTITEHFRLLQACDNLSLLTCVAYASPAHLLHPLPLNDGSTAESAGASRSGRAIFGSLRGRSRSQNYSSSFQHGMWKEGSSVRRSN